MQGKREAGRQGGRGGGGTSRARGGHEQRRGAHLEQGGDVALPVKHDAAQQLGAEVRVYQLLRQLVLLQASIKPGAGRCFRCPWARAVTEEGGEAGRPEGGSHNGGYIVDPALACVVISRPSSSKATLEVLQGRGGWAQIVWLRVCCARVTYDANAQRLAQPCQQNSGDQRPPGVGSTPAPRPCNSLVP